jgi:hypothetical protein
MKRKISFCPIKRQTLQEIMFYRFDYEAAYYPKLDRLPLHVRMKLDLTGVKLSLKDWLAFHIEERTVICHLPVDDEDEKQAFREYLNFLSQKHCGAPAKTLPPVEPFLWEIADQVPSPVLEQSAGDGKGVALQEWINWASHQRYALYKTAVSRSEPEKFFAVLDQLRKNRS